MHTDKKGLLIAFPGTGYTCREPLFADLIAAFDKRSYSCISLDFSEIPFKQIESIDEAFELTKPVVQRQLSNVNFCEFDDVFFLAKSFGTGLASWYGRHNGISARCFYLTPTDKGLSMLNAPMQLTGIVTGTEDHVLPCKTVEAFCAEHGIQSLIIDGVGHKLKFESAVETIRLNNAITAFLMKLVFPQ